MTLLTSLISTGGGGREPVLEVDLAGLTVGGVILSNIFEAGKNYLFTVEGVEADMSAGTLLRNVIYFLNASDTRFASGNYDFSRVTRNSTSSSETFSGLSSRNQIEFLTSIEDYDYEAWIMLMVPGSSTKPTGFTGKEKNLKAGTPAEDETYRIEGLMTDVTSVKGIEFFGQGNRTITKGTIKVYEGRSDVF